MQPLFVDFEARSRADIECTGSTKYARHPSTEVLVMAYGFTPDDVKLWHPGDPVPREFRDRRMVFAAQNAGFEIAMMRYVMPRHGFPKIPDSRWVCSAAACGYVGLPQGLDKVSQRLDLGELGKDADGHANMLKLCRPFNKKIKRPRRKKGEPKPEPEPGEIATVVDGIYEGGEFNNDPIRHAKNDAYCAKDVRAEITAHRMLPRFPKQEQRVWQLHRKINQRGVPVDLDLCRGAVEIIADVSERYCDELRQITGDTTITIDCRERMLAFCESHGVDMRLDTSDPDEKPNLQEGTVIAVLERIEESPAKRALEIRQLLTSAAIKKFQATIDMAEEDWRCRDWAIYYGAGPGRWSSHGPQFQNMKRPDCKPHEIEEAIPFVQAGDVAAIWKLSKGDPFGLLSDCVRSIIMAPPGRKIVVSDFSSVEARKLAWLSGCENLLGPFRRNEDLYVKMAMDVLGCTRGEIVKLLTGGEPDLDKDGKVQYVDGGKEKRQLGKVPFLGAGYQMGWSHLKEVAKKQAKVDLTDDMAQTIVDVFRSGNPEIPKFWRDIENAAKWCVCTGKKVVHPKFQFRMVGPWLAMRIPSGRELFYFEPRFIRGDNGREQLVYTSPRGMKQLYGGLLTENITQASSRDLLADAMLRMDAMGLYIVLHCHDESVIECDESDETTESLVHWAMQQVEPWAVEMPLAAETHSCKRYTK